MFFEPAKCSYLLGFHCHDRFVYSKRSSALFRRWFLFTEIEMRRHAWWKTYRKQHSPWCSLRLPLARGSTTQHSSTRFLSRISINVHSESNILLTIQVDIVICCITLPWAVCAMIRLAQKFLFDGTSSGHQSSTRSALDCTYEGGNCAR